MRRKLAKISLSRGQLVRWEPAPDRIAQIDELRTRTVRLYYRARSGRVRRPIVDAFTLDLLQIPDDPVLPLYNPMGRGIVKPQTKTFVL
jgi:hypothetical protein